MVLLDSHLSWIVGLGELYENDMEFKYAELLSDLRGLGTIGPIGCLCPSS
jgi:hypothetical protein